MAAGRRARLGVGKVPPETLLQTVYKNLGKKDVRVIVGPGIGRDSAAVRQNSHVFVFTADPITGTHSHIGQHSVEVNANDIATTGARPKWYLCTILLPVGTREDTLREITSEIHQTANKLGVSVVGGHTEATPSLDRPIISGFMIGETRGRILTAGGGKSGDGVLLAKTAGLEGTAILARDKASLLKKKGISESLLRLARQYQEEISVVKQALRASKIKGVHALHDPTEGGVLNGLWEIAEASRLGIEVWADTIPIAPETRVICHALGLDPLKLMSSGTLLMAVEGSENPRIQKALSGLDSTLTKVGRLTPRARGRILLRRGKKEVLRAVPRDELYRV
ncbi:MAG TPA: AIR synthase family protein [Candidatus Bathyarchaeia archaeon]|jgi:hydrogenase maturation factor|nr:AIR synthase family protein [Candidatus Bathyarchaeia archaeon]